MHMNPHQRFLTEHCFQSVVLTECCHCSLLEKCSQLISSAQTEPRGRVDAALTANRAYCVVIYEINMGRNQDVTILCVTVACISCLLLCDFSCEDRNDLTSDREPTQSKEAKQRPSLLAHEVLGSRGAIWVKAAHRSMDSSAQPRLANS